MASILKQQILKHLSRFTKNLSVDQINLEVLRGRGQLKDLELNEQVLTELLELPTWLRLNKATCHRVSLKIPWTKLTSSPTRIVIDEVQVELELNANLRECDGQTSASPFSLDTSTNSLPQRVVEGMSLYVNSLEVFVTSEVFRGSFVLSRLSVESRTPTWEVATDLHLTRIRNRASSQSLIFKHLEWQALRIEASALDLNKLNVAGASEDSPQNRERMNYNFNASLRLITSRGRARITMKKSLIDGYVSSSRIQIILDDLLWVATVPQLRSALKIYRYVLDLVESASAQRKACTCPKHRQSPMQLTTNAHFLQPPCPGSHHHKQAGEEFGQFQFYNVMETSYHFYAGHIDVHICDDTTNITFPEDWDLAGASMQVSVDKLAVDLYPYHHAVGTRTHWIHYKGQKSQSWVSELLKFYHQLIYEKLDNGKEQFNERWQALTCSVVVLRLTDMYISCVDIPSAQTRLPEQQHKILCSDRDILKLPADIPLIYLESGEYYFPKVDNVDLPVPPRYSYIDANPIRVRLDLKTLRWLNYLYVDVCTRLNLTVSDPTLLHCDIRVEGLMPKFVIPISQQSEKGQQVRKPLEVDIQISSAVLTNTLIGDRIRASGLKNVLSNIIDNPLFNTVGTSSDNTNSAFERLPTGTVPVKQYFAWLAELEQLQSSSAVLSSSGPGNAQCSLVSNCNSTHHLHFSLGNLKTFRELQSLICPLVSCDIWTAIAQPLWMEFAGSRLHYPKPMPFLMDATMTAYLVNDSAVPLNGNPSSSTAYVIVHCETPVKLCLNHYQYLMLLELSDMLSSFMQQLTNDTISFASEMFASAKCFSVTSTFPLVECSIILPNRSPISPYDEDTFLSAGDQVNSDSSLSKLSDDERNDGDSCLQTQITTSINVVSSSVQNEKTAGVEEFPEFSTFDGNDSDSATVSVMGDDLASVCTDFSDDEKLVLLDVPDPFEDIFRRKGESRDASPAEEADRTFVATQSMNNKLCARILNQQVTVVTFSVLDLDILVVSTNPKSVTTDILGLSVNVKEQQNISLNDFHVQLAGKTFLPSDQERNVALQCGFYPLKVTVDSGDRNVISGVLRGLKAKFSSITMANLSGFFKDDRSDRKAMQMCFDVQESAISISDKNYPPFYVNIANATINQQADSEAKDDGQSNLQIVHHPYVRQLEQENVVLRRKLAEAKHSLELALKDGGTVAV